MTTFRVIKPTGVPLCYEFKHRHMGVAHSERSHDKPGMGEVGKLCSGADARFLQGLLEEATE